MQPGQELEAHTGLREQGFRVGRMGEFVCLVFKVVTGRFQI